MGAQRGGCVAPEDREFRNRLCTWGVHDHVWQEDEEGGQGDDWEGVGAEPHSECVRKRSGFCDLGSGRRGIAPVGVRRSHFCDQASD